jgi:hypothetical protein
VLLDDSPVGLADVGGEGKARVVASLTAHAFSAPSPPSESSGEDSDDDDCGVDVRLRLCVRVGSSRADSGVVL